MKPRFCLTVAFLNMIGDLFNDGSSFFFFPKARVLDLDCIFPDLIASITGGNDSFSLQLALS